MMLEEIFDDIYEDYRIKVLKKLRKENTKRNFPLFKSGLCHVYTRMKLPLDLKHDGDLSHNFPEIYDLKDVDRKDFIYWWKSTRFIMGWYYRNKVINKAIKLIKQNVNG